MVLLQDTLIIDPVAKKNIESWLTGPYDEATKKEIEDLLKDHPQEISDAFYRDLDFGTGGLRGIMGVGCNRINKYTIRAATQALANYLHRLFPSITPSVFIGYDTRLNSRDFAVETAKVLAGNQIKVFFCDHPRPVPLVSFGCRYKKCQAGIMITASHNPAIYNGYKVYWSDGCQVLPPHDKGIISEYSRIKSFDQIKIGEFSSPNIVHMESEIDQAYMKAIEAYEYNRDLVQQEGKQLNIAYTSLHGTGINLLPKVLKSCGFTQLHLVEEQCKPDGNFPTIHFPNPEERSALKLGIELMLDLQTDILLATDPDCDRVGVTINHKGGVVLLTGNQVACLCLEYLCQTLSEQKKITHQTAFIKTIVTTELFRAIANKYGLPCFDVLTGFKFIGEKISQWEQELDSYQFIFGGEESFGYLLGTHVRDKDGVISSVLICEAALKAKLENKTLVDKLYDIYKKYGVYRESLITVEFEPTKQGMEKLANIMKLLRAQPPKVILGTPIVSIDDYLTGNKTWLASGKTDALTLPKSNVLTFNLADNTKLVIRPSGTEPKIKLYCGTVTNNPYSIDEGIEHCDVLATDYLKVMENFLLKQ